MAACSSSPPRTRPAGSISLPGLGTLLVSSVSDRDYPVVQGVTLLFAVLIVAINLLTDIVQAALDPRVGQEIGA